MLPVAGGLDGGAAHADVCISNAFSLSLFNLLCPVHAIRDFCAGEELQRLLLPRGDRRHSRPLHQLADLVGFRDLARCDEVSDSDGKEDENVLVPSPPGRDSRRPNPRHFSLWRANLDRLSVEGIGGEFRAQSRAQDPPGLGASIGLLRMLLPVRCIPRMKVAALVDPTLPFGAVISNHERLERLWFSSIDGAPLTSQLLDTFEHAPVADRHS
mmetsp:Transcript_18322/g.69393  ORF Transcript_18322/g.69393 Transcript_18322/m.69393 type:complete len:213 (+) Transcript_18322:117-755(+)|eukprot:scaffold1355_cov268-Pinguiococcus_pyrenoidosus.AAC.90